MHAADAVRVGRARPRRDCPLNGAQGLIALSRQMDVPFIAALCGNDLGRTDYAASAVALGAQGCMPPRPKRSVTPSVMLGATGNPR